MALLYSEWSPFMIHFALYLIHDTLRLYVWFTFHDTLRSVSDSSFMIHFAFYVWFILHDTLRSGSDSPFMIHFALGMIHPSWYTSLFMCDSPFMIHFALCLIHFALCLIHPSWSTLLCVWFTFDDTLRFVVLFVHLRSIPAPLLPTDPAKQAARGYISLKRASFKY